MSDVCPMFCVCAKCSARIANEHRKADEACGRDWDTGGCQCGACRMYRATIAEIHRGFARIEALQRQLSNVRALKRAASFLDKEGR
jgi:hypothetical protein